MVIKGVSNRWGIYYKLNAHLHQIQVKLKAIKKNALFGDVQLRHINLSLTNEIIFVKKTKYLHRIIWLCDKCKHRDCTCITTQLKHLVQERDNHLINKTITITITNNFH